MLGAVKSEYSDDACTDKAFISEIPAEKLGKCLSVGPADSVEFYVIGPGLKMVDKRKGSIGTILLILSLLYSYKILKQRFRF